jgi:hypothetical protein
MRNLIAICEFYSRQVNLIAFILSLLFATFFAIRASSGPVALDLFALFYGGIAGYSLTGFLMVPVFFILKYFGEGIRSQETTSALEGVLFRRPKKNSNDPRHKEPDL